MPVESKTHHDSVHRRPLRASTMIGEGGLGKGGASRGGKYGFLVEVAPRGTVGEVVGEDEAKEDVVRAAVHAMPTPSDDDGERARCHCRTRAAAQVRRLTGWEGAGDWGGNKWRRGGTTGAARWRRLPAVALARPGREVELRGDVV